MFRRVAALHGVKKTLPIEPQKPFKLWEGGKTNLPPLKTEITVDSDMLIDNFKTMVRIRRMEQLCDQSYKLKKIRGFCHLYIGQESIAVGMENVLTFDDAVVTAYRDHGWYVVRGGAPYDVFCEQFWKKDGCSKGKGGSMHMYNVKNNFYGGNGIVGAQVPIGVGLGWKHSYTNGQESPKNVSVALYGDGAANQGQIFEVMNMAALFKIPTIFVCENNQFGMGTSKKRASAQPEFYRRCDYIPGVYADGMCTLSVQEATRYAKEYCLAGNGPIVIEFDSYRYMGHSMSDPDSAYRKAEDIEAVRSKRDCIENLRYVITSNGFMNEAQLKDIEKEIRKQVDSEHTKAHAAPIQDDMKELVNDIYAKDGPTKVPIRSCQGNVWLA